MQNERGHKNPSKFYKFMTGELSVPWASAAAQTTHLNKPGRVLSADTVSCSLNGVTMNLAHGDNRDGGWRTMD